MCAYVVTQSMVLSSQSEQEDSSARGGGQGGEEFLSTRLLLSMNIFMQEHCHSSLDNRSRLGYHLECWNGFPSHITASLILSLCWTDGTIDSDLHSA